MPRCRSTATRCSRPRATRCGPRRSIGLAEGPAGLLVRLDHAGPGPRLRLGWTRPDGRRETIPPRSLGPPRPAWVWALSDALALVAAVLAGAPRVDGPLGRAAAPPFAPARDRGRDRGLRSRLRPPARDHELASGARPGAHGADGPSRRPPQRLDPRLGGRDGLDGPGARLPGPRLPPAAGRAGLLREPAAAGRARRAAAGRLRSRPRLQHRPSRQPPPLGPRPRSSSCAG